MDNSKINEEMPITTENNKEYEMKVAAAFALKCLQDSEHFWLAVNMNPYGQVDDIILHKKTKTDRGITYLYQLKHQCGLETTITRNQFLTTAGDFSFVKYIEGLSKLDEILEAKAVKSEEVIKRLRRYHKMVFVICTNSAISSIFPFFSNVDNTEDMSIIRIDGKLFRLNYETLQYPIPENIKKYVANLFLLTDQPNEEEMTKEIERSIKDYVKPLQLDEDDLVESAHQFLTFVTEWSQRNGNVRFIITKTHVLKKLNELLLKPYVVEMKKSGRRKYQDTIWTNIMEEKYITVVNDADDVVDEFIKDYIHGSVKKELDKMTSIDLQKEMRMVLNTSIITYARTYELFWKTQKVPLLLRVTDSEMIHNLQHILKFLGGIVRLIILNKSEMIWDDETPGRVFTNFLDLEETYQELLESDIKFQGRDVQFKDTVSEDMFKFITTKDIIYILSGKFNIGCVYDPLPDNFVDIHLEKVWLRIEVLNISDVVFVIKSVSEDASDELLKSLEIDLMRVCQWRSIAQNPEAKIIFYAESDGSGKLNNYCAARKIEIHFLELHNTNKLEWSHSFGSTRNLRPFRIQSPVIDPKSNTAKLVLDNMCYRKKPLLISAHPGMGKTVLINYFSLCAPSNMWVLKMDLPEYGRWKRQKPPWNDSKLKTFLDNFLETKSGYNDLAKALFQNCYTNKNILFLLDGFDEIPAVDQNEIQILIKYLRSSGYTICVTTRSYLQYTLEPLLDTLALSLKTFELDDQLNYLTNYFSNFCNAQHEPVRLFSEKLLLATRQNLNDEDNFTGVPLQLILLAETYIDHCKRFLDNGEFTSENFDLIYFCESFLNKKSRLAQQKLEGISVDMIHLLKPQRALFALQQKFSSDDLKELNVPQRLQQLTTTFPNALQLMQKDGVVLLENTLKVSFIHKTFAEYLAAQWLTDNMKSEDKDRAKKLIKKTFDPKYAMVRNSFDRILAKDSPLHKAIINRHKGAVHTIIVALKTFDSSDKGNRTILHLLASRGLHHTHTLELDHSSKDDMMEILKLIPKSQLKICKDDVLNYTPLDYAIASGSLSIANALCAKQKHYNSTSCISGNEDLQYTLSHGFRHNYTALVWTVFKTSLIKYLELDSPICEGSKLHCAAATGNSSQITLLISAGANINEKNISGHTPLLLASTFGNKTVVNELLLHKASVDLSDTSGRTALHWAVIKGYSNIVSLLLSNNTNVDVTDLHGMTALHYALLVSNNHQNQIITLLLKKKANIEIENNFKQTPMHYAHLSGDFQIIFLILNNRAEASTVGLRTLHWAPKNNQEDLSDLYLSKSKGIAGKKALISVIRNCVPNSARAKEDLHSIISKFISNLQLPSAIKILLRKGADVNEYGDGMTPLHWAAWNGLTKIAKLLLSNDADIKAKTDDGSTALHLSAQNGYVEILTLLINKRADVAAQNYAGETPLHLASQYGHGQEANLLISYGADVNGWDMVGRTALHHAAMFGQAATAKQLLFKGAIIESKCDEGRTALHLAAQNGYKETVNLLLSQGAYLEETDDEGRTALHYAAIFVRPATVKLLLSKGANIERKCGGGRTALHLAAQNGYKDTVHLLIARGSNLEETDCEGRTALQYATTFRQTAVVRLLISKGATVSTKDDNEIMAVEEAMKKGRSKSRAVEHEDLPDIANVKEEVSHLSADVLDTKTLMPEDRSTVGEQIGQGFAATTTERFNAPMRYKKRPGTIDLGKTYETQMAALLSLRCVLHPEDLCISSNVDGVGAFDEIVLRQGDKTFLLQLKHKENPKPIMKREFMSIKGDFALSKYMQDVDELKQRLSCKTDKLGVIDYLGNFNNMYFVLFTNRDVRPCEFLENHDDYRLDFLNTNTVNNVYKVRNTLNDISYSNTYLFCNQVGAKGMDEMIIEELKKIVKHFELEQLDIKPVAEGFIKYVKDWSEGNLGGHYVLTKCDILNVLADLLFDPYRTTLTNDGFTSHITENTQIWNEIVQYKAVIGIDFDEHVSKFLSSWLANDVKKYCVEAPDSWTADLSTKAQNFFYQNHEDLKMHMLKILGNRGKITARDIYKCLWMDNRIPLMLDINTQQEYQDVLQILKLSNSYFKLILFNKGGESLSNLNHGNVKYLYTLQDLNGVDRYKILMQTVNFQGRSPAYLGHLIDRSMFNYVTCNNIIHILLHDFNIGENLPPLPEYFVENDLPKVFILAQALNIVTHELFLIEETVEEHFEMPIKHLRVPTLQYFDVNKLRNAGIIVSATSINMDTIQSLKSTQKTIHILVCYDKHVLEWKASLGSIESIKPYRKELNDLSRPISRWINPITIVDAAPGMGKSVLTDYVAHQTPTNKWVLRIDLNKHVTYFRSDDCKSSTTEALQHLQYFKYSSTNTRLDDAVFTKFATAKDVVVLLDGFDEVSISYKEEVMNIAKALVSEGYCIWITTRPHMTNYLELTLKSFSVTLKPLCESAQRLILYKYFRNSVDVELYHKSVLKVHEFIDRLLCAAKRNLSDQDIQFMGIPLQTMLLADVFQKEFRDFICDDQRSIFNEQFDLLDLCQLIVERKIDVLSTKYGTAATDISKMFKDHQAYFALKYIFPFHRALDEINKKLDGYYKNQPDNIQLLQRIGIATVHEDLTVHFVHNLFAEYLAAQWLADNLNSSQEELRKVALILIKERFCGNCGLLFNLFDQILSKNCPLHLAIINKEEENVIQMVKSRIELLSYVDKGGRNGIHMAALYGVRYPPFSKENLIATGFPTLSLDSVNMLYVIQTISKDHPLLIMQTDALGYTPLDYALGNRSFAIANKLSANMPKYSTININISLNHKKEYLGYCGFLDYKILLKVLLQYFARKDLLLNNVHKKQTVKSYLHYLEVNLDDRSEFEETIEELLTLGVSNTKFTDLSYSIAFNSTCKINELALSDVQIKEEDEDHNTPLHYAVAHGKLEIVVALLAKGVDANKQNIDGNTPLHLAILKHLPNSVKSKQFLNIAKDLLYIGKKKSVCSAIVLELIPRVNINIQNLDGDTPLHLALKNQHKCCAKLLISYNPNIDLQNNNGLNVLHLAVEQGYTNILFQIISSNQNLEAPNTAGDTPLAYAIQRQKINIAKELVDYGANVNAKNARGETAVHLAAQRGLADLLKLILVKGASVNEKDQDGNIPLFYTIADDKWETVQVLLANGADVRAKDTNGATVLHYASLNGCKKVVTEILAAGANVNECDNSGRTPLFYAAQRNQLDSVNILVNHGADIGIESNSGKTVLHIATESCWNELLAYLLGKGVNVNIQDNNGETPLFLAVQLNNLDAATLLFSNGADLSIKNKSSKTVLDLAKENGFHIFLRHVLHRGSMT